MRVLTVLFALVATPLLVCVSQSLPGKSSCSNGGGTRNRSLQGTTTAHKGSCVPQAPPGVVDSDGDGVSDTLDTCANTPSGTQVDASGCAVQSSPPPASTGCVNSSQGTGSATIGGQVYVDRNPWPYLGGWCIQLRDESGAVVATAVTDTLSMNDEGVNFLFTRVPAGTYTVCEVVKDETWYLSYPGPAYVCGSGGYTVPVTDGAGAPYQWFGNLPR